MRENHAVEIPALAGEIVSIEIIWGRLGLDTSRKLEIDNNGQHSLLYLRLDVSLPPQRLAGGFDRFHCNKLATAHLYTLPAVLSNIGATSRTPRTAHRA